MRASEREKERDSEEERDREKERERGKQRKREREGQRDVTRLKKQCEIYIFDADLVWLMQLMIIKG